MTNRAQRSNLGAAAPPGRSARARPARGAEPCAPGAPWICSRPSSRVPTALRSAAAAAPGAAHAAFLLPATSSSYVPLQNTWMSFIQSFSST